MAICKFFQRGNCKYGNSCWNDHIQDYNFSGAPQYSNHGNFETAKSGFTTKNRFSYFNSEKSSQNTDDQLVSLNKLSPLEITKLVSNEMLLWNKTNMWPYSCFTYAKERPSISGFADLSFEELRLEAYTAMKSNDSFNIFKKKMSELKKQYRSMRQLVYEMGPEVRRKIIGEIEEHNKKLSQLSGTFTPLSIQPFSDNNSKSSTLSNFSFSLDTQTEQPTQGFKFSSSPTSNPQTGSLVFSNVSTPVTLPSFGSAPAQVNTPSANDNFRNSPGFKNVFGTNTVSPTSTDPNILHQKTGNSFESSSFINPNQQKQTGLFGKPITENSGPTLSTSSANQNFSNQGMTRPFESSDLPTDQLKSTGLFGKPIAENSSFTTSCNNLSTGSSEKGGLFGKASDQRLKTYNIYTDMNDLNPEELKQFKSDTFTLGSIPTRPPPKELCF